MQQVNLAWLTSDQFSFETWSGNHTFIFLYLRRGLRMPRAVYWALRMSIKCACLWNCLTVALFSKQTYVLNYLKHYLKLHRKVISRLMPCWIHRNFFDVSHRCRHCLADPSPFCDLVPFFRGKFRPWCPGCLSSVNQIMRKAAWEHPG